MKKSCKKISRALGVLLLALAIGVPTYAAEKPAPVPPPAPAASAPAYVAKPIFGDTSRVPDKIVNHSSGVETVGSGTSKLADAIDHNRISINFAWTLLCSFLVMFMQAGFALVETGLCRAKNASHTMAMNMMIYCIGILGFWASGFAIQMGGVGGIRTLGGGLALNGEFALNLFGKTFGLFGTKGFFLSGAGFDMAIFALFVFQMVFMDTAATIPTGAMAERFKFSAFCIYAFMMSGLIYPLFANWVWGGGWLSQLGVNFGLGHGHVDFAGSSVVHMTGGVCALAGAMVLGPRIGKYGRDGAARPIPGHHIPMAITGTLILAFGWFGFNAGSTLAGSDLRIGLVAANTMLASAAGAFSAMLCMWLKYGKPDLTMSANGLLAGLVAITASCAFVTPAAAVFVGLLAGVLCCVSIFFFERIVKIDDPVGAISVHGVCGAWGVLALGLFANGTYGFGFNDVQGGVKGLFYGDPGQLLAQCIGICTDLIFVFTVSYAVFKVIDLTMGMRVLPEVELEGLDRPEVAVEAYPDFNQRKTSF